MVKVVFTTEADKQMRGLPRTIRARLYTVVERLQAWPEVSGTKPLRKGLAGHYRIRTGDYRLQFRVEGDNLIIEKIGHRDGFYGD